jgi:hypothetical protein
MVEPSARYPHYVCSECSTFAKSKDGRALVFMNESISGGYIAAYADTGGVYDNHDCYIHGIKCRADEHYFGGIVIVKVNID